MDGKVLILCDELPGDYEEYSVKDRNYLVSPIRLPEDDLERIFVCWDSIIPEDRRFIEMCKYYARFTEKPEPNFVLSQTGATDSRSGTIKSSIQEQAYFDMYQRNIGYLSTIKQKGEDVFGEAMELAVQFPFDANEKFFEDFSNMLNLNNIVTILPSYSINSEQNITKYRMQMLEAWQNANKFMDPNVKSCAKVVPAMTYKPMENKDDERTANVSNSEEAPCLMDVYNRAGTELLKIYSMPIFGEPDDKKGEEEPSL